MHATAEKRGCAEAPQYQVGIGHRGLGSAPAVAGRARVRAGRFGADTQGAARVNTGDASAPGPDGLDVNHGDGNRKAPNGTVARHARTASRNDGDIKTGSAHVGRNDVSVFPVAGNADTGNHPAGRAGENGLHGLGSGACR